MNDQKTIVIDINLTRGLAAVLAVGLLALALLGYLLFTHEGAAASSPAAPASGSDGMRIFYLTKGFEYTGSQADGSDGNGGGVCGTGYHFASLWEILDTSNLKYQASWGRTRDDSGQGPPILKGWVRTGNDDDGGTSSTPGVANCMNWGTSSGYSDGTYVKLDENWSDGGDIGPWEVGAEQCNFGKGVWCIED